MKSSDEELFKIIEERAMKKKKVTVFLTLIYKVHAKTAHCTNTILYLY